MTVETTVTDNEKKIYLKLEWPYRLLGNIIIICFVFSLAIITVTLREEIVSKTLSDVKQYSFLQLNKIGFTLDDVIVENRNKTPLLEISKILNLNRSKNILDIDVADVKKQLESLPWIKAATVRREFFPNVIHITLKEKTVESLWQFDGKFYPIDEDGEAIPIEFIPNKPIMLIVGKSAPKNFKTLLEVIKTDSEIFSRIKVANFISERRWNIVLDSVENGITVKLPEAGIKETWEKLIKINNTKGIFKRKLTIIDLRLPDKVIVKIGKMNPEDKDKLQNTKESKT